MKINKITNAQEFFKVVDDCKGRVELLTGGRQIEPEIKTLPVYVYDTDFLKSRRTAFGDRCK